VDVAFLFSYGALWALVCIESLVLVGMVQAFHRHQNEAPNAYPDDAASQLIGSPLPQFQFRDQRGVVFQSAELRGQKTVLLFVSPRCPGCAEVLNDLRPVASRGKVIIFCRGPLDECRELAAKHFLEVPIVHDIDFNISAQLHIDRVPTAVSVDSEGRIVSYGRLDNARPIEAGAAEPAEVS